MGRGAVVLVVLLGGEHLGDVCLVFGVILLLLLVVVVVVVGWWGCVWEGLSQVTKGGWGFVGIDRVRSAHAYTSQNKTRTGQGEAHVDCHLLLPPPPNPPGGHRHWCCCCRCRHCSRRRHLSLPQRGALARFGAAVVVAAAVVFLGGCGAGSGGLGLLFVQLFFVGVVGLSVEMRVPHIYR